MPDPRNTVPPSLSAFPKEVAVLVQTAISFGVEWRQNDGRHIYLYSGETGRPMKVSASVNPKASIYRLERWIDDIKERSK